MVATGTDAAAVASQIVDELAAPDLRVGFVFADWRLDPQKIARTTARGLEGLVVGGTTCGIVGAGVRPDTVSAIGLGLYGDAIRVGVGVATDLPKSALARARDAVHQAATALRLKPDALDSTRHVGVTLADGTSGNEEAFCIGSAAAVPQIRVVGGCASTELNSGRRSPIWVNGEVLVDAGLVILLDCQLPFAPLTSAHLVPTERKTVVTSAAGRVIHELDGRPAARRLRELVAGIGETLHETRPMHTFARYIDGMPYVRSIHRIDDNDVVLASAVESGHVLRLMRPGDLIGTTQRDLAAVAQRVGGHVVALLAFSCLSRHWEAEQRGTARALAASYAAYPTVGFQSSGEQAGMLLVNHTLTGLAIGGAR